MASSMLTGADCVFCICNEEMRSLGLYMTIIKSNFVFVCRQPLGFVSTKSQSRHCDPCGCFMTCRLETKIFLWKWMPRRKPSWTSGRPRRRVLMGYESVFLWISGYGFDECALIFLPQVSQLCSDLIWSINMHFCLCVDRKWRLKMEMARKRF